MSSSPPSPPSTTLPVINNNSSSPNLSGSKAVGKLLIKRARMTHSKSCVSLVDSSTPSSGAVTPKVKPNANIEDCVELCRLLLEKVGADARLNDTAELDRVLSTEYPPGVADLLGRITGALDTDGILDSVSDITDSSDEESSEVFQLPRAVSSSSAKLTVIPKPTPPTTEYKSDTEIALSRIFNLGKFTAVQDPSIAASAPYHGPKVISMTGFGELGRFGNQVLQYMFLKAYATLHNIPNIQVPQWVGASLFGLDDEPVARALPAVVEYYGTLANSTFTDELIHYVKKSSGGDGSTAELNPSILSASCAGEDVPTNVDIWGWFQWNSSVYEPFKSVLRETFKPVPELDECLVNVFDREIRYRGGRKHTVIGVHLRYGDYQNIAASSFGYCAPTSWYVEWLKQIWGTVENPILVVTSDALKLVIDDFAEFNPVTTNSAGMNMPVSMKGLKAGFFPDWYALTQCDIVGISNSTFSFSACLMNERENLRVYRAHYAHRMVEISPWNADPIVHRDVTKNAVSRAVETLRILYNTQGSSAVLRNVLYELPLYGVRSVVMKAVLWRDARNKLSSM